MYPVVPSAVDMFSLSLELIQITTCVVAEGEATMKGERINHRLLSACRKEQVTGGWWASVMKSITAESVKGNVLLQFWVRFARGTSLKKFVTW